MKQDTIVILGIPIDDLNMDEAVDLIFVMVDAFSRDGRPRQVITVNVDFLVNTLSWQLKHIRHPELLNILRRADLVTADGMPIVWTSKLLGAPLKERVTGADLVPRLAEEAAKRGKSLFLLGGRGDVGKQAAQVLKHRYPDLRIAGVYSPHVHVEGEGLVDSAEEDTLIIEEVNRSGADILLIGFGNPKQEVWFERNRKRIKVPVSIGIGGTYEFITGSVARAPEWMQKAGLEWLFRISQDPKRLWKRYLIDFFKFSFMILPAILFYRYQSLRNRISQGRSPLKRGAYAIPQESFAEHIKVIKLPDRLDAASLDRIRDEIDYEMESALNIVLDFRNTSFIDSSGLGFIIRLWRWSNKEKRAIYMIGINSSIIRFFRLNRLWDLFKDRTCKDFNEIIRMIKRKTSLPSFYLITESDSELFRIDLYGTLDANQMSNLDMVSITRDIGDRNCILNLDNLNFVDSTGLVFLVKIQKHLASNNKVSILCNLPDNVLRMFHITKLVNLFQIVPDVPSAKKRLEKMK